MAEILVDVAGTPAADVHAGASFPDREIDSLTLVEIVVAAEERFGIQITDSVVKELTTVGDLAAHIGNATA